MLKNVKRGDKIKILVGIGNGRNLSLPDDKPTGRCVGDCLGCGVKGTDLAKSGKRLCCITGPAASIQNPGWLWHVTLDEIANDPPSPHKPPVIFFQMVKEVFVKKG